MHVQWMEPKAEERKRYAKWTVMYTKKGGCEEVSEVINSVREENAALQIESAFRDMEKRPQITEVRCQIKTD